MGWLEEIKDIIGQFPMADDKIRGDSIRLSITNPEWDIVIIFIFHNFNFLYLFQEALILFLFLQ